MALTAKDAKIKLLAILESDIDAALVPRGFTRRAKDTVYHRTHRAARQQIELFAQRPNNSGPRTEALVQTYVSVELDAIVEPALALVCGRGDKLGDAPGRILRMPTGFTTPKRAGDSWRPEGPHDWTQFAREFVATSNAYVVPFLDEYSDAEAFARGWDRADGRLVFLEDVWVIKLAAAYLAVGEREQARKLVTERLAGPSLKKRFASAFAYFG
jgi:hypothetical protein